MHIMYVDFVLYTTVYRFTERKKKRFHVKNCPCGTVGAELGYVRMQKSISMSQNCR